MSTSSFQIPLPLTFSAADLNDNTKVNESGHFHIHTKVSTGSEAAWGQFVGVDRESGAPSVLVESRSTIRFAGPDEVFPEVPSDLAVYVNKVQHSEGETWLKEDCMVLPTRIPRTDFIQVSSSTDDRSFNIEHNEYKFQFSKTEPVARSMIHEARTLLGIESQLGQRAGYCMLKGLTAVTVRLKDQAGKPVEKTLVRGLVLSHHGDTLVRKKNTLGRSDFIRIMSAVEEFMRDLHDRAGRAHNDLSPEHIVLDRNNVPSVIGWHSCAPLGTNMANAKLKPGTQPWFYPPFEVSAKENDTKAIEKINQWYNNQIAWPTGKAIQAAALAA